MQQTFIKMNNNDKHLSLGNFCRLVKEISVNKSFASQPEIFYAIFEDDTISDSAINNYCIGCREIGQRFKEQYLKYKTAYENDHLILSKVIFNIGSILEGNFNNRDISKGKLLKKLALSLYNLAKNDTVVSKEFTKNLYKNIENDDIIIVISDILFFIVLEKKQPIYIEAANKEIIENLFNNTDISINELEKFLKLQLKDGVNYFYSIKKLALEENPYACFELGEMEYKGEMIGKPRYIKAFEYLKIAASKNHPRANWLIAQMFLYGQLGKKTKEDFKVAFEYLKKAETLGSVAAINTIGLFYLNGYVPGHKIDEKMAITYFEKASLVDYVYAYNNLGKIYEARKNFEKAFDYYLKSAELEESWACNKVGEFYRKGIGTPQDMSKAFHYYQLALNVPEATLEYWALFNLAKYFYLNGNYSINLEADRLKAIKMLESAAIHGVDEALEELIYIYINEFTKTGNEKNIDIVNAYVGKLINKPHYEVCKDKLGQALKELKKFDNIEIIFKQQ